MNCANISQLKHDISSNMTCCLCSRSHEVRLAAEANLPEKAVLPDTGSPEAHHLEETIIFNQATKGKHIQWQKQRYWLTKFHALEGKCKPDVIAKLAVALQRPVGIMNIGLRKSCVFLHKAGARPICLCCALELTRRKSLLLLVHREAYVFVVNHPCNRVDMRVLRLCLRRLFV